MSESIESLMAEARAARQSWIGGEAPVDESASRMSAALDRLTEFGAPRIESPSADIEALIAEARTPVYPTTSDEVWKTRGVAPVERDDLIERLTAALEAQSLRNITRVTVVGDDGAVFERYALYANGARAVIQDEGRTLKILPREDS